MSAWQCEWLARNRRQHLMAIIFCRIMHLCSKRPFRCNSVPLESLTWCWYNFMDLSPIKLEELHNLARLTTLTHLELRGIPYQSGAEVLQALSRLQSLSLTDCQYMDSHCMELDLLAPGAFPALTSLHIEQHFAVEEKDASSTVHPQYAAMERQKLVRAQQAISGMANLKVLSGLAQALGSCDLA